MEVKLHFCLQICVLPCAYVGTAALMTLKTEYRYKDLESVKMLRLENQYCKQNSAVLKSRQDPKMPMVC